MSEHSTATQVLFEGSFVKPLLARFDQPRSSSDAGAVLLGVLDDRLGITSVLARALPDERDPGRVRHSQLDLVRQRVYAIACGYEDGNDAARLRYDPTQLLLLGRDPLEGDALGSQPTISRFENRHELRSLITAGEALMDSIISAHRKRLGKHVKRITIDLDGTVDPAYGHQQDPKGTDFSTLTPADLDAVADELNTRPRRTLERRTLAEVYAQEAGALP